MVSLKALSDLLKFVRLFSKDGSYTELELAKMNVIHPRPFFPDTAFTIDISEHVENNPELVKIVFIFHKMKNLGVEIELVDRELENSRRIFPNTLNENKIKLPELEGGKYKVFTVEFSLELNDEDDENVNCKNYPTKNHENFSSCDLSFLRSTMDGLGLEGYNPIWSSNNMSNVSKLFVTNLLPPRSPTAGMEKGTFQMLRILDGRMSSSCSCPCQQTKVLVQEEAEEVMDIENDVVDLEIVQNVTKTETIVNKIKPTGLLSIIGSGCGLWLGLNLPKILHHAYNFISTKTCCTE